MRNQTTPPPTRTDPRCLALGLGAMLALAVGCGASGEETPPSVILISIDTLRADHLGLYGYERETSPYLDRLAQESVVFERAFAPAPWTLISHMTMLTGLYPNQHGVVSGDWALARETPLLAESLSGAGYRTIALYFEGWIHERHGFDRGFDVFRPHENAEEAEQHLVEVSRELDPKQQPFFLFLHLFDVHCGPLSSEPGPIYDCPPPYDQLFLSDAAQRIPEIPEGELWVTPGAFEPDVLEGLTALYDGGIRYVDDKLELWIEEWRRRGWLENTLLIVTADHGESLGQRGMGIRDHGGPYQEGIRVPLIVRPPTVPMADPLADPLAHSSESPIGASLRGAGTRIEATVHLADIVPTVLREAGLGAVVGGRELPGFSLLGELPRDRTVYALSPETFEMVVRWPHKWVRLEKMERCIQVDLDRDPGESVGEDLSVEEFGEERKAFLAGRGDATPYPPPLPVAPTEDVEELMQRLSDMGYTGGAE